MYLYIIAIGWGYVVLLMAATSKSLVSGILTFVFYGLIPLALVFYITLKQMRRSRKIAQERLGQPDRADSQADQ